MLTVADDGTVTRDNGPVTERDVTVITRCLVADGRHELAALIQGWWGDVFYAPGMTDRVTVRVPDGHSGATRVVAVAKGGALTREDGATVTEADVTAVVATLTRSGWATLAGRVQGWWWTSQGA